jgi:ribose transport system substrate-binding protein
VDGIELAPSDREALVRVIRRAREVGIPLTVIDSGVDCDDYISFVATDNYAGGVLAARRLGQILTGRGAVAVIGLLPGAASTTAREEGFKHTIAKMFPEVRIVAFQYGMSDRARSLAVTEDILTAHPELDGIFASAEPGSIGAAQALKELRLAGKVKLVGFDSSASLVDDLRNGVIDSLVVQEPFQIGYLGLKTLVDAKAGRKPSKHIDLSPTLVTKDELNEPRILQLLNPEVNRYLH